MTFKEAARQVLAEAGRPMHYQELAREILERGLVQSRGRTPEESLNSRLTDDINRLGEASTFVRVGSGLYALRSQHTAPIEPDADSPPQEGGAGTDREESERRVRTPLFPKYDEVRHLLGIWRGRPKRQITRLRALLLEHRGTPQNTADWKEPDLWIPRLLSGEEQELANAIWHGSEHSVNPRHIAGHWLLSQHYNLIEECPGGELEITDRGRDFLEHERGSAERFVDEQEGLLQILTLIVEKRTARRSDLLDDWTAYLNLYSNFGSSTTFSDTLARRLRNLVNRRLILRRGVMYEVTNDGRSHLQRADGGSAARGDEQQELLSLSRARNTAAREQLRELLLNMDAVAFEHLVKHLLEKMGYQNVEVTSPSADGGIDVVGDIEVGITQVREVVQAKRHRNPISLDVLDRVRGILHRFSAIRGTIITTSRFSRPAEQAAFEEGGAPITLIDGDKLIELLIEHGIGIEKRSLEVLTVVPDNFRNLSSPEDADGSD